MTGRDILRKYDKEGGTVMGTSNISEIGRIFIQNQAADAGISVPEESKVSFSDWMGQMAAAAEGKLFAGMSAAGAGDVKAANRTVQKPADVEHDYAHYRQRREVQTADSSDTKWKDDGRAKEALEKFSGEVKEVLKEELGVSDEQIEDAMSVLGLSYADLMNPNQLASLVAELTGETDPGALLVSGEFMTVMQAVNTISESLLQELGLSREAFMEQLKQAMDVSGEMTAGDSLQVPTEEVMEDATDRMTAAGSEYNTATADGRETEGLRENAVQAETAVRDDAAAAKQPAEAGAVQADEEAEGTEAPTEKTGTEEPQAAEKTQHETEQDGSGQSRSNHNRGGFALHEQGADNVQAGSVPIQNAAVQTAGAGNIGSFAGQMDIQNIIRQIAEFSRVIVNNASTTMEMQLNPENLGKLMLSVTTKNGVVSAQIYTQNEAVKEALEQQLVTLKQEMNQAGVKVDAVEVAVGSHEFERNLEQNAQQEQRQAEEQEKTVGRTRHINLNSLDELGGVMSEEESLVAQMMAEQGNSVDFTA